MNFEKPLISVIIPVYNLEEYLEKCLDSVLSQSYRNIEVILIDDGSSDRSPEICDGYAEKDSRIRVIHKKNGGVSAARNDGLAAKKGGYVTFVDGDDLIDKDYIGYLYELMEEYDADISAGGVTEVYEDGRSVLLTPSDKPVFAQGREAVIKQWLSRKYYEGFCCGKLYRHEAASALKFSTELHYCEDNLALYGALRRADKIVYGSKKSYYYFQRSSGSATSKIKSNPVYPSNIYKITETIKKDITENFPACLPEFRQWSYSAMAFICIGCDVPPKQTDGALELIWRRLRKNAQVVLMDRQSDYSGSFRIKNSLVAVVSVFGYRFTKFMHGLAFFFIKHIRKYQEARK